MGIVEEQGEPDIAGGLEVGARRTAYEALLLELHRGRGADGGGELGILAVEQRDRIQAAGGGLLSDSVTPRCRCSARRWASVSSP